MEKSFEAYKKAISLKPDYAEAHQNLGYALINSGRLKEGLDEYEWRWKTLIYWTTRDIFYNLYGMVSKSLTGKRILIWSFNKALVIQSCGRLVSH